MDCEELLKMLNEYVDGTVDPSICEDFGKTYGWMQSLPGGGG